MPDAHLSRDDFLALPLDELARLTGLTPPPAMSPESERAWRERAFEDYQLDIDNEEQWGNTQGGPRGL